jgi:hypothetical protein
MHASGRAPQDRLQCPLRGVLMTARCGHERSVEAKHRILWIADLEERIELVL